MAGPKGEETALGSARVRFIESLPRKAIELRGALALLTATPAADGPREDMRRRLHTLYASALVFRNDVLAAAVKQGLELLDAARDELRSLDERDLDALARLVKRLPELRGELSVAAPTASGRPKPWSGPPGSAQTPSPSVPAGRDSRTLTGLAAIGAPSGAPAFVAARVQRRPSSVPPGPATQAVVESVSQPALPRDEGGLPASARPASARPGAAPAPRGLQTSDRAPLLQMVVHVLALAKPEELAELGAMLPSASFVFTPAQSVDAALGAARANAPDVVLADRELARDGELVRRLRSDPLTDFVPVVLLQSPSDSLDAAAAHEAGADDVLLRPLHAETLTRALGAVTGTLIEAATGLARLGDATLDQVAECVAREVRRGIVDAAERGRDFRIPLGEGAEVLAAAWAAVARVRAFVAQQSGGRVRFVDRPRRGGPALLALVGGEPPEDPLALAGTLAGRRILVVDDDPAVVWFFAGLLREEGATVVEANGGREALTAARTERPDAVISDILMPELDGFGLCRELKRDPALADVPVILISWKQDLLHRMRELSAGASGYLRKEAGAAQILACVRDVMGARTRLEAQLTHGGEVRGSLEGTGVVPLLRSVRRARQSARVTIRDAWNLFECEIRDGRLAQLTRTATDGSFARGERALPQLLGASAGRFAVKDSDTTVRQPLEGTLDDALQRGARSLGAIIDAVSGAALMKTERLTFDEESYPLVLRQSPAPVREIVERLHAGEAPSMLLSTGISAQTLESVLMDLGRRGAVHAVHGKDGQDLIALALAAREDQRPVQLATPRSIIPPPPNPVISVRVDADPIEGRSAERGLPSVLDPFASFVASSGANHRSRAATPAEVDKGAATEGEAEAAVGERLATAVGKAAAVGEAGAAGAGAAGNEDAAGGGEDAARAAGDGAAGAEETAKAEEEAAATAGEPPTLWRVRGSEPYATAEAPTRQFQAPSRPHIEREPGGSGLIRPGPALAAAPVAATEAKDSQRSAATPPLDRPATEPAMEEVEPSMEPPAVAEAVAESKVPSEPPLPLPGSSGARERAAEVAAETPDLDLVAREDRRSRGTLAGWGLAFVGLFGVGLYLERVNEPDSAETGRLSAVGDGGHGPSAGRPSQPAPLARPAAVTATGQAGAPAVGLQETRPSVLPRSTSLVTPEDAGFVVHGKILDTSVKVDADQALLVVEASVALGAADAELSVDDRPTGPLPASLALSEGIHELSIKRGDRLSYRYVSVHAGRTWVLREP